MATAPVAGVLRRTPEYGPESGGAAGARRASRPQGKEDLATALESFGTEIQR